MNKKGFVLSTYVYILLVFFLLLLGTMLAVMNNTKLLSNKLKEQSGSTSGLSDKDYSFILLGDKDLDVVVGTEYEEPGFIAKTSKGIDITDNVKVVGNVDINAMNEYTLTYKITYNGISKELKRKVNVIKIEGAEFIYTGDYQIYSVSYDGYYQVELWGAQGGNSTYGGKGAYVSGIIKLERNEQIYVYVGGEGPSNATVTNVGGYNGGGYSGNYSSENSYGGGGATDVRLISGVWNNDVGLNSRIMVAAGGAGSVSVLTSYAPYGGTLVGGNGTTSQDTFNTAEYLPTGATQIDSGFAYGGTIRAGNFGYALQTYITGWGGGGGGGYYGGNTGYGTTGSGGSSFMSGYAGVNSITSSTDRTHTNNTLHYSNKYFIDGKMQSGVNSGNGKAKITYLGSTYEKKNTKFDNVRYIKDCINGSTVNAYNHWLELQAISNGANVAYAKYVSSTSPPDVTGDDQHLTIEGLVDGDVMTSKYIGITSGEQCVTVDLEDTYDLDEIAVWHYYATVRSYNNHSLYVSPDNTNWTTLIDNVSGVIETANGIRVSAYD